jgi:hypothetical protein
LDENLLEAMADAPVLVSADAKRHLARALHRDSQFLADLGVRVFYRFFFIIGRSQYRGFLFSRD